jgi:hypothetical protein
LHASPAWIKGRGTRRHRIVLCCKVSRGFPLQIYEAFKTRINYLKIVRDATAPLQFSKLSIFIARATKRNPILRKFSSNVRQKRQRKSMNIPFAGMWASFFSFFFPEKLNTM